MTWEGKVVDGLWKSHTRGKGNPGRVDLPVKIGKQRTDCWRSEELGARDMSIGWK